MRQEQEQHPAKKLKLDSCCLNDEVEQGSSKPVAILAAQYTRPVETVSVYVAELLNPKLASKYIRELKETFPLKDLQHLKRIKRTSTEERGEILQVLIKPVSNDELVIKKYNKTCEGLGQPYIVQVPKHLPLTREQFNEASNLWPTSFHEDKDITKMISGELFDDAAVHQINKYMLMAIEAAKTGKSNGMVAIGAVVVDPSKENVVAIAYDLRCHGNPLQHAVMVVIDLIAQSQSGGTWNLGYQQDGIWTLHTDRTQKQTTSTNNQTSTPQHDKTGPYLCTGYDLYITREPCVMCAMSLVHSRIRRVFYGCRDSNAGALGSKYSLHVQDGLNHHFQTFCGVLQRQCDEIVFINP